MTEEQAMKWARSTCSMWAVAADDGDKDAQANLKLMALAYCQGWWARDITIQRAARQAKPVTLGDFLKGRRMLAAAGEEC